LQDKLNEGDQTHTEHNLVLDTDEEDLTEDLTEEQDESVPEIEVPTFSSIAAAADEDTAVFSESENDGEEMEDGEESDGEETEEEKCDYRN